MNIKSESNLKNHKVVYDLTKYTSLDYPRHLSCIVWFTGCNIRCTYCYNDDLVFSKEGKYTLEDVLSFLKTRVGLLDGVVLSGGEATNHKLVEFCREIKKLGFKIKLDTNGVNTKQIQSLIEEKLLDYIALDFKATKDKYKLITGTDFYNKWLDTLKYLLAKDFDFEVRTTVNGYLLNENNINEMIDILYSNGYKKEYYLQNFLQTSSNIGNITENRFLDDKKIDKSKLSIVYRN